MEIQIILSNTCIKKNLRLTVASWAAGADSVSPWSANTNNMGREVMQRYLRPPHLPRRPLRNLLYEFTSDELVSKGLSCALLGDSAMRKDKIRMAIYEGG